MRDSPPSRLRVWAWFAFGTVVGAGFFAIVVLLLIVTGGDLTTPVRAKYLPPAWLIVGFATAFGAGVWAYTAFTLRTSLREIRGVGRSTHPDPVPK